MNKEVSMKDFVSAKEILATRKGFVVYGDVFDELQIRRID